MAKLTLLVGPPGSGKSTLARKMNADGVRYINQDSQGKEHLHYFDMAILDKEDIVVDRMNFNVQQRSRYLDIAKKAGYQTEIIVLHQPYQVCLERIRARQNHETIKDEQACRGALNTFFTKYERVREDEADVVTRVWPEGDKPSAIICDLDGTLCNIEHRLHFVRGEKGTRDWGAFFKYLYLDNVNEWCADILHSLKDKHQIVYCSGRPDNNKRETTEWLKEKGLWDIAKGELYMRPRSDHREDSIIKEILLDFEILTRYTPYFAIDDRARVVAMWRKRGITTLACAEGDF